MLQQALIAEYEAGLARRQIPNVARRRPFGMNTPYVMTNKLPGTAKANPLINHHLDSSAVGHRKRIAALSTAAGTWWDLIVKTRT